MTIQTLAHRAYSQSKSSTRTERDTEYEILARVSHRIKSAAQSGSYPKLIEALSDNQRLWTALAVDVADEQNGLPQELRAKIFYLAEFVQAQTNKVLTKKGGIGPLLEINTSVLRGLSGRNKAK